MESWNVKILLFVFNKLEMVNAALKYLVLFVYLSFKMFFTQFSPFFISCNSKALENLFETFHSVVCV